MEFRVMQVIIETAPKGMGLDALNMARAVIHAMRDCTEDMVADAQTAYESDLNGVGRTIIGCLWLRMIDTASPPYTPLVPKTGRKSARLGARKEEVGILTWDDANLTKTERREMLRTLPYAVVEAIGCCLIEGHAHGALSDKAMQDDPEIDCIGHADSLSRWERATQKRFEKALRAAVAKIAEELPC